MYNFLILLTLTGCSVLGGRAYETGKGFPNEFKIGSRDIDKRAKQFGLARGIGSVVNSQNIDPQNAHEQEIVKYGKKCVYVKGVELNGNDILIVSENLTEQQAGLSLEKQLADFSEGREIGYKTSKTLDSSRIDINYYESDRIVISKATGFSKKISRAVCRFYVSNMGGQLSYAVAVFPKDSISPVTLKIIDAIDYSQRSLHLNYDE